MKTKLVIFTILMAAGLSAASAQTVTFAVDFGAGSSQIYSGTFGGTTAGEWSGLNAASLGYPQSADASITLSNVTLTFTGGSYGAYDVGASNGGPADALLKDFFYAPGGDTSNFTISGLLPTQTLTLSFVGSNQPFVSDVTFGGNTIVVPGNATADSGFTSIATVNGVSASTFNGSWTGEIGNEGDLAGAEITITTVPEPSTYAMLGFGLCGLVALRFRRRHVS
ncbi:MAG: PEP-CTERM sorting domain-containing protein [Chthoniobacteraceae bacterium]